jgi:hypothetical protein
MKQLPLAALAAIALTCAASAQPPSANDSYLVLLGEREALLLAYSDLCLGSADGIAKSGITRMLTAHAAEVQRVTPNDDARGFYRAARSLAAVQIINSGTTNAARCLTLHQRAATLAMTHIGMQRP